MTATQRGLGRGLDALFAARNESGESKDLTPPQHLLIRSIEPNPQQPRKRFDAESLQELAQSIRQQGVLQPILVRPDPRDTGMYQIVAGERRWRAAALAELSTIPALIQDLTDTQSLIIGLVENLQREDLNPMEEAEALEVLQQELGLSQEALANKIGRSRPSIANCLRLLHLEDTIREAVRNETLSAGAARSLLSITDPETRLVFFEYIQKHHPSVRRIEAAVGYWKTHGQLPENISNPTSRTDQPPPFFEQLKTSLAAQLKPRTNCRVSISGTHHKGRITLSYRSEQDFYGILEHFGISPDYVSRET